MGAAWRLHLSEGDHQSFQLFSTSNSIKHSLITAVKHYAGFLVFLQNFENPENNNFFFYITRLWCDVTLNEIFALSSGIFQNLCNATQRNATQPNAAQRNGSPQQFYSFWEAAMQAADLNFDETKQNEMKCNVELLKLWES